MIKKIFDFICVWFALLCCVTIIVGFQTVCCMLFGWWGLLGFPLFIMFMYGLTEMERIFR
jgi:hypothetical protein